MLMVHVISRGKRLNNEILSMPGEGDTRNLLQKRAS